MYQVIDAHTGLPVRRFPINLQTLERRGAAAAEERARRAAYRYADRSDAEYGAVRYIVQRISQ